MSLECLSNDLYSKTKFLEKKSSLTGSGEATVKEYMNGAILIESGTESECELHSRSSLNKSFTSKQSKEDNSAKSKKVNFAKLVAKSIEQEMLANENEDKEVRMQESKKQYDMWLEKKKKEKTDKIRMEKEKLRDKEMKKQADKKFRSIQNDLKYKLWLKKKEQEELEHQWKQLKMLMETNVKK